MVPTAVVDFVVLPVVGVTTVWERVLPGTVMLSLTLTTVLPLWVRTGAVVGAEVMVAGAEVTGMVSSPALRLEHTARPALCAWPTSVPLHLLSRQGAATPAMAACVGPHWQATSVSAQPAAVMAEVRQGICRARMSVLEAARPAGGSSHEGATRYYVIVRRLGICYLQRSRARQGSTGRRRRQQQQRR